MDMGLIVNPSSTVNFREHEHNKITLMPLLGLFFSDVPTCSYIYHIAQPHLGASRSR